MKPPSTKKHILIAEDDAQVAEMLTRLLTEHGYETTVAKNGMDMVRRIGAERKRFDLLLVDLYLPLGHGDDMLAILREKGIAIPAIIITAYEPGDLPLSIPVLRKPFENRELLRLIREKIGE